MSDGYAKEEVLLFGRSRGDRWIKSLEREALRNDFVRWGISGREKPCVQKQREKTEAFQGAWGFCLLHCFEESSLATFYMTLNIDYKHPAQNLTHIRKLVENC